MLADLPYKGEAIRLYFNEATADRGAYFAASARFYESFSSDHWLEVRNCRSEPKHLKLIPYPGEEILALKAVLSFVEHKRAA